MIKSFKQSRVTIIAPTIVLAALATTVPASADTYQYDALGRLVSVTYSNGLVVTYTYDAAGNRRVLNQTPP